MANQAQRIIERARRLPVRERRRVVSALEASLAKPPKGITTPTRESFSTRQHASVEAGHHE
jgi:hypothetical protein